MNSKLIILAAAVVAMSAGYWLSSLQQSSEQHSAETAKQKELAEARQRFSPIQGVILSPPRKISVPALLKDDGSAFVLDDLRGHWSLLFYGYSNCPDICPVTMGMVAKAKKDASEQGLSFPEVFFISVDPERDQIEMLGDYIRYFDQDFVAVTGEPELIKALALQMSVVFMKMPSDDAAASGYLIDHSSALLLLDPEGRLTAFLNPPHDPATILKDIETVIGQQH